MSSYPRLTEALRGRLLLAVLAAGTGIVGAAACKKEPLPGNGLCGKEMPAEICFEPFAKNVRATGTGEPAAPPSANGPLLIRLPPLVLVRTLPGAGKRQLSLTIALFFRDPVQSQKLQDRAALVQDAILSYVQALSPAQFVEPNQLTLKDGITAAIIAKVPDFPPDAVLIPEMEAGVPDAREGAPKGTAP